MEEEQINTRLALAMGWEKPIEYVCCPGHDCGCGGKMEAYYWHTGLERPYKDIHEVEWCPASEDHCMRIVRDEIEKRGLNHPFTVEMFNLLEIHTAELVRDCVFICMQAPCEIQAKAALKVLEDPANASK